MLNRARPRVMFVDDDRAIHRTIAKLLSGFDLVSVYDGASALVEVQTALALRAEFALVILDVAMPGWGGLETLERIWQVDADIQALFCTGSSLNLQDIQARFGDSDAILVVKKPFSPIEIAQAAQALTTKWRLQRQARAHLVELEAAVRARTTELEAANKQLASELAWRDRIENDMRVSQRLETVGQLAAGIAHEINNPLQYVGDHLEFVTDSTAELLALIDQLDDRLGAEGDNHDIPYMKRELPGALEAIQDGIHRITAIVRAMKELSHPGTRDARVADINRAIDSALEISATSYRSVADLERDLAPLPPVTCFIAELGQVFLNLIVNAAQAMEGRIRGKLRVRSAVDGDCVVVSVSDTGGGIPPEIQQRIFDPFFTTKEVGHGTGQGLAIARAIIVERHGGTLSFDTAAGEGTTFVIRIPIAGPKPQSTAPPRHAHPDRKAV